MIFLAEMQSPWFFLVFFVIGLVSWPRGRHDARLHRESVLQYCYALLSSVL